MVNFMIIGPEAAMQKVFTTAGWVKVDADVKDAFLHGFVESMSKESYLTMPMSQLYLFGRPQDYGWAHAEPIQVVASRNHLRVWKAPFDHKGCVRRRSRDRNREWQALGEGHRPPVRVADRRRQL
jgi:hypothetical protein